MLRTPSCGVCECERNGGAGWDLVAVLLLLSSMSRSLVLRALLLGVAVDGRRDGRSSGRLLLTPSVSDLTTTHQSSNLCLTRVERSI